jgi:hypothetical protein
MKKTRLAVGLPASLAAEIDTLVGKGNRSAFATEVAEREVGRLKVERPPGEACGADQELV